MDKHKETPCYFVSLRLRGIICWIAIRKYKGAPIIIGASLWVNCDAFAQWWWERWTERRNSSSIEFP